MSALNSGFVKICPKCATSNPEYENLCQKCGFFIAMEPAQMAPASEPSPALASTPGQAPLIQAAKTAPNLQLGLPGFNLVLQIKPGDVLGQAHPQSDASIQLPETLPDVAYVHRRHCCFWQEGGQWQLEAIDQSKAGGSFTNPTWVNGVALAPGERRTLGNGDDLRLSAMTFLVSMQL